MPDEVCLTLTLPEPSIFDWYDGSFPTVPIPASGTYTLTSLEHHDWFQSWGWCGYDNTGHPGLCITFELCAGPYAVSPEAIAGFQIIKFNYDGSGNYVGYQQLGNGPNSISTAGYDCFDQTFTFDPIMFALSLPGTPIVGSSVVVTVTGCSLSSSSSMSSRSSHSSILDSANLCQCCGCDCSSSSSSSSHSSSSSSSSSSHSSSSLSSTSSSSSDSSLSSSSSRSLSSRSSSSSSSSGSQCSVNCASVKCGGPVSSSIQTGPNAFINTIYPVQCYTVPSLCPSADCGACPDSVTQFETTGRVIGEFVTTGNCGDSGSPSMGFNMVNSWQMMVEQMGLDLELASLS